MKVLRCWPILFLLVMGAAVGCGKELRITVVFDRVEGLKPGDSVVWEGKDIGVVKAIEVNEEGRFATRLAIKPDFREKATDQCRFLVQAAQEGSPRRSVGMICAAEGGVPLADGAEIEGSTAMSVLIEQGGRNLEEWSRILARQMERWTEELRRLPDSEWYKHFESELENWSRELERAGKDARRRFREEVLPRLEESLKEFKKRLEEHGSKQDARPLEKKLDGLKTI